MQKKGIDISHHQGDINFDKLKGNIDFAMVRTSYGTFYEDRKYKENIIGLEKIGVPYGLYHFSYAKSKESALKEAIGFKNIIKNYKPLYPVVIDIESSKETQNLDSKILNEIAYTFCTELEKYGYYVMIYANLDYFNNKLFQDNLNKFDRWLAEWRSEATYNKPYGIWQYSSKGSVPGINGNVDLDISYKDYPKIIKENKLNNYETDEELVYIVKKGDTLSSIASIYNTTYQKLALYNNIDNPNLIYPGNVIKIPNESVVPNIYIVKKNDSLSKIAKLYGTTWEKIYKKNKKIIGENPNKIYPGQILKI